MPFFDEYPYTNFHNVNLDWILERVKQWGQMVEDNNTRFENLEQANEAFKTYVTEYLENLDVQTAIDDKLDRMFESGELTDYLQPYVSSTVTTWLDRNITEPVGVIIDSSLTVEGAAADAGATGDEIKQSMVTLDAKNILVECFKNISWYKEDLAKNYINRLAVALGIKSSERRLELPNEYEQVSYIYGIAGQYINTGIKSRIPFEFKGKVGRGTGSVTMGSFNSSVANSRFFSFGFISDGNLIRGGCRYSNDNITVPGTETISNFLYSTNINLLTDTMYDVTSGIEQYENNVRTYIEINDVSTEIIRTRPDIDNDFYIFNVPSGNTASRLKLGEFRLISGDIILADYIPCYRKSDNTIGFYDVVSQELKTNNGTGTFEIGEVIA